MVSQMIQIIRPTIRVGEAHFTTFRIRYTRDNNGIRFGFFYDINLINSRDPGW